MGFYMHFFLHSNLIILQLTFLNHSIMIRTFHGTDVVEFKEVGFLLRTFEVERLIMLFVI